MSGGSYEYLYAKEDKVHHHRFDDMVERVKEFDPTIAYDISLLKLRIVELEQQLEKFAPLFQAIEWCDSCDTDEKPVLLEIQKLKQ